MRFPYQIQSLLVIFTFSAFARFTFSDELPPGLAKKGSGDELPPGLMHAIVNLTD